MVAVTVTKRHGEYVGMTCMGHAQYAKGGSDVVCAAVSVLVINTLNAIEALTGDAVRDSSEQERGFIEAAFDAPLSERAAVLMDAMVMGLEEIERQYGRKYLTFTVKEAAK